jgi:hypothetical protein
LQLIDVCQFPDQFQQALCGEKSPTLAYVIQAFDLFIERWKEHTKSNPETMSIIEPGLKKLTEYYKRITAVPAYSLALGEQLRLPGQALRACTDHRPVLNPRWKLSWHEKFHMECVREVKEMLIEEVYNLCSSYAHIKANIGLQLRPYWTLPSSTTATPANHLYHPPTEFLNSDDGLGHEDKTLEEEVARYLTDSRTRMDPIAFWQVRCAAAANSVKFHSLGFQANSDIYPTLFKLALDLLPVAATSVSCERVFSSAKETISPRRNRLGTDTMEHLQIVKWGLKHSQPSSSFARDMFRKHELPRNEVLGDLELLAASSMPVEPSTYAASLRIHTVNV